MNDVKLREERLKLEKKLKNGYGNKIFLEEVMKSFEENNIG